MQQSAWEGGAGAGSGLEVGVETSIPFLDLPLQLFVLGTALGMAAAMIEYRRTGGLEQWPVTMAAFALTWFAIGLLVQTLSAII